jgi:hypothetical protein
MSKEVKTGGTAFPFAYEGGHTPEESHGMTLRDYFAGKAMQSFASQEGWVMHSHIAESAYQLADAMLEAQGNYAKGEIIKKPLNEIGATHYAIDPGGQVIYYKYDEWNEGLLVWLPRSRVWDKPHLIPYTLHYFDEGEE